LYDQVRGVGPNKALATNSTGNEGSLSDGTTFGYLSAFNSNGFTVVKGSDATSYVSGSGQLYSAFGWNAGSLATNSAYNQSQAWSTSLSSNGTLQNAINAFDGSTSTRAQTAGAAVGKTITFAPATGVSFTTSLEVYCDQGNSTPTATWNSNTVNPGGGAWVTVYSGSGTISSSTPLVINTETAGQYATLKGIRLDGKVLVDKGVIPAGSLNSSTYTTGTYTSKWDATGSTGSVDNGLRAFNGNTGNYASNAQSNTTVKWAPDSPITVNSLLRIRASGISGGSGQVSVNGTGITVTSSPVWYTISASSLSEIALTDIGSTHGRLWAVEVDGKILVDSNQTPPNVPTIATTSRGNSTAGISVCTYTGTGSGTANSDSGHSFAHNLSKAPDLVICKKRNGTNGWPVFHSAADAPLVIGTNGQDTSSFLFAKKDPTSTVVFLGNNPEINKTGDTYLAYCFSAVENFSAFGKYTGSGSQKFIHLGFKPAWLMIKRYTDNTVGEWTIYDSASSPNNEIQKKIWANGNSVEEDHPNNSIDFVSNGFVVDPGSNAPNVQYTNNGNVGYLYAAFASAPFQFARAR
tara:strand:- start:286 stop:2016 length:1731 start_codon:yes stop_codon:yes gene_type:complete